MSYKKLTPENWLEADSAFLSSAAITVEDFLKVLSEPQRLLSKVGLPVMVKPADWLKAAQLAQMNLVVPEKVRSLFEAARGMFVYGYLYYPLCTLAAEQLYRVFEAAVSSRCAMLSGPKDKTPLQKKIQWLMEFGTIFRQTLHSRKFL